MVYRLDGATVVGDTEQSVFRVRQPFRRVLNTLPGDDIPTALVIVGVLTGHLRPSTEAAAHTSQGLIASADDPPTATVSAQTVSALQWFLHEVADDVASARKQQIGAVIEAAGLQSAGTKSSERSDPDETTTADAPLPETLSELATADSESNDGAFECEFCGTGFEAESDLRSHWLDCESRPSDARFECPDCGNEYIAEFALTQHCEDCTEKDNLETDQEPASTTQPTTHRCADCGERFDSRGGLRAHAFTCGGSGSRRTVARGASGTVVHADSDGYGFISTPAIDGRDVFFHVSNVPGRECEEGTILEFDIVRTDEGYRAINISRRRGTVPTRHERFASDRARWSRDT